MRRFALFAYLLKCFTKTAPKKIIGLVSVLSLVLFGGQAFAGERPDTFADLAERLSPSFVSVSTTTIVAGQGNPNVPQFPQGSPFQDFFEQFSDQGQSRRAQALGSGFIIDTSGIVVTNNHVIENADEIIITLSDETSFKAEVIGSDKKTDVAVLKFDPGDVELSAVSFGDSNGLRVGDWVIAIGNPFGLGGTVTAGIVSARGRDIGSGPYDDFIQTDASINHGNSGGPLFNTEGAVIGINTAIFSQSGGSVGIGFAISANLAKNVVKQLREHGRMRRGWLGVFIQEVTPEIAESLGLEEATGALVSAVTEGGPAEIAGIEAGDVIHLFDGKLIERMRDLPRIVAETPVEKEVDVDIIRNDKPQTLMVTLGELEKAERDGSLSNNGAKPQEQDQETTSFGALGLSVQTLNAGLAGELGLDAAETGVVITEVIAGSPAAEKGLQPGDLIKRLGQSRITSAEELKNGIAEAREAGSTGVLILIQSAGRTRFVQLGFVDR